jgi:protein-S-isoprenylcysteine O-methyltransferase Ste14
MKTVHEMFNHPGLRKFFLRLRVPLALIAGIILARYMKQEWFWIGLAVSFVGACLQWWCFACLKKQKVLAFNGPYGFVRNPMYLGRYILLAGAFLMTGNLIALAIFTILYWFYMVNRVGREEVTLSGIFGKEYDDYIRDIPRFIPSFRHHPAGQAAYFSWATFQKNHGLVNAIGVIAAYTACWYYVFHVAAR